MALRGEQRGRGMPTDYRDAAAVVPSDAADLPDGPCIALVAQVAGNVALTPCGGTPAAYVASTGDVTFTVEAGDDTITRDAGSWIADGIRPGIVEFEDTLLNDTVYSVATVTALILTLTAGEVVVAEVIAAATMNATGYPVVGVAAGVPLPIHTSKVWATDTTATGIVALYT